MKPYTSALDEVEMKMEFVDEESKPNVPQSEIERQVTCPHCSGKGESMAFVCGTRCDYRAIKCSTCEGTGSVTTEQIKMMAEAEIIRKDRIARGLSIREEGKRLQVDFPEWSRIEAGRAPETDAGRRALATRRDEMRAALASIDSEKGSE
jgi:hypothetical protein